MELITVILGTSEFHFSDIVENIFYDIRFLLIIGADITKEHGSTSTCMPLIGTCRQGLRILRHKTYESEIFASCQYPLKLISKISQ